MGYVLYVVDCETTGLDPVRNDVIEVCFWRLGDEESKTWWMKPINIDTVEDSALKVNNHKRDDILHKTAEGKEKYRLASDVLPEIEEWLMQDSVAAEDRVFIGQNPEFDYNFLINMWKKTDHEFDFPFGYWMETDGIKKNKGFLIDTIDLARLVDICTNKKRKKYNLGSLVKDFGITKCQAHRADGDVKMTKELFEKIISPVKSIINDSFSSCYTVEAKSE